MGLFPSFWVLPDWTYEHVSPEGKGFQTIRQNRLKFSVQVTYISEKVIGGVATHSGSPGRPISIYLLKVGTHKLLDRIT